MGNTLVLAPGESPGVFDMPRQTPPVIDRGLRLNSVVTHTGFYLTQFSLLLWMATVWGAEESAEIRGVLRLPVDRQATQALQEVAAQLSRGESAPAVERLLALCQQHGSRFQR